MTVRVISTTTMVAVTIGASLLAGQINGKVTANRSATGAADAVVYLEKIAGREFSAPMEPVVLDQKGKEFSPGVLPVLAGTRIDFLNSDSFSHNVFAPDKCAGKFDLGSWSTGVIRSHIFDQRCEAVILCKIHPEMVAYIIVVETPYFAVTDQQGRFTIPDVPDGTYTVSVWHERFKKQSRSVKVNGAVEVDLVLKR